MAGSFTGLTSPVEIGQPVTATLTCTVAGTPTDPTTLTVEYENPNGGVAQVTLVYPTSGIVRTSAGVYAITIMPTAQGTYFVRAVGTGACAFAIAGSFDVNPTAMTP